MTGSALTEQLRGDHAAIRAARRRRRFAQRRNGLLLWTLACYVGFLIWFLAKIPA